MFAVRDIILDGAGAGALLVPGLLIDRREPAGRAVGAAALAGLAALVVDIFVL